MYNYNYAKLDSKVIRIMYVEFPFSFAFSLEKSHYLATLCKWTTTKYNHSKQANKKRIHSYSMYCSMLFNILQFRAIRCHIHFLPLFVCIAVYARGIHANKFHWLCLFYSIGSHSFRGCLIHLFVRSVLCSHYACMYISLNIYLHFVSWVLRSVNFWTACPYSYMLLLFTESRTFSRRWWRHTHTTTEKITSHTKPSFRLGVSQIFF